jgi:hypothetical protein
LHTQKTERTDGRSTTTLDASQIRANDKGLKDHNITTIMKGMGISEIPDKKVNSTSLTNQMKMHRSSLIYGIAMYLI